MPTTSRLWPNEGVPVTTRQGPHQSAIDRGQANRGAPDSLPAIAAVAAITTTTIAATPAASAATAPATAAAVAATSTAVTSTAATAAPASAATTGALSLRPRLVDHQVPSTEILTVQGVDGALRVFVIGYFNERETTRLSCKAIADQIDTRRGYTDLREPFMKLIFRRGKRKIPNVELLHLPAPSARNPVDESRSAPKRQSSYAGSPGSQTPRARDRRFSGQGHGLEN